MQCASRVLSLLLACVPPLTARAAAQGQPPPPTPTPMVDLAAAYPRGEQLCAVPIPGNTRVVVAQGATLAIVDTTSFDTNGEPRALQYLEIPEVSPMAMRYRLSLHEGQEVRNVYIAGGTTGVWRVALCNDLFTSSTPTPCAAQEELIDRVGCDANFAYKRCVDVEVLEGVPGLGTHGLLLALFSASSDHSKRAAVQACPVPGQGPQDLGGTELRAYRLLSNGVTVPYSTLMFPTGNIVAPVEELGMAIAADPGDAGTVYVSLGAGGIRRVDISTSTFSHTAVALPGNIPPCGLPNFSNGSTGCPQGEHVRDLAVVRLANNDVLLYAALEYGRVVEANLTQGTAIEAALGEYFPMQIAARVVANDDVIVAVSLDLQTGVGLDSTCPYRPGGVWSDMCILPGLPDPSNLSVATDALRVTKLRFLARSPTSSLASIGSLTTSTRPNSLEILPTSSAQIVRLYASTSVEGLQSVRLVKSNASTPWQISNLWAPPNYRSFRGFALSAADVALSKLDDTIGLGGYDGWAQDDPGRIYRIQSGSGVEDIEPVPNTVSACPQRTEPFPTVKCGSDTDPKLEDPVPFGLGIVGTASWRDPFDQMQVTEWFLSGHDTKWFASPPPNCAFLPSSSRCMTDPCTPTPPINSPWSDNLNIPGCATDVGWFLARMRTVPPATGTFDGIYMAPQWWQLPSDNATGDTDRSLTAPYTSCVADPRTVNMGPGLVPVPKFLYLARNGGKRGLKVVRTSWLMDRALGNVPGSPAGGAACASGMRGFGEPLATADSQQPLGWNSNWDLEMLSLDTHLELATTGCSNVPQIAGVDCSDASVPFLPSLRRYAFNNSAHVFSVRDELNTEHWVVAVAAGFVTSGPNQTYSACPWNPYYRRALTVFYEVTGLTESLSIEDPAQSYRLLAAAIGPNPTTDPSPLTARPSHAFVVQTKPYGTRTHAFVADLLGRVLVYDVSWDRLRPSGAPPLAMPNLPGDPPGTVRPLLEAHTVHTLVQDPFDGRRPNCVDLAVDPATGSNTLYCATARGGIHVLEIQNVVAGTVGYPTYTVIDTPGVATGLALRMRGLGSMDDQLLVGDSRAGVRLYRRMGQ